MPSSESQEFWVIFDTGTRPEYYQDVHNLLALPRGAVMRYDYRDIYLSERALRLAVNDAEGPAKTLLIYGQKSGFTRGISNDAAKGPAEQFRWVATRFGTMLAIPSTNGANFFFDFAVEGYPKLVPAMLSKLMAQLIADSETPFTKWVAVSDDISVYNDLNRGDEEANWEAIVDAISASDMQFKGDSFWRLKPTNAAAHAKQVTDVDVERKTEEVRQVSSRYELSTNDICTFEAISYSPVGRPTTQLSRVLRIHVDSGGPVALDGPASIDLRQYTAKTLRFRARRPEEDVPAVSLVKFETVRDQTVWPDGPNLELLFQISPQRQLSTKPAPDPRKPNPESPTMPPMPQPQPHPPTPSSTPEKLTPWFVLQAAIKAVPAVKYALGVAGLASAAAIARSFFESPGSALVGTIAVFVLAVLLFVFSSLTKVRALVWLGLFLTWSLTLLFVLGLALTFTTVFFGYPMPYSKLVHQFQPARRVSANVTVEDKSTHSPIVGAVVSMQGPDGRTQSFTTVAGRAYFHDIVVGDEALVATVYAAGYTDFKAGLNPSDTMINYTAEMTRLPEVQSPPVSKPVKQGGKRAIATPPLPSRPVAAAPNMNGTWEVLAEGDINNLRLRDGTFQFQAQPNREIQASANFVLDGVKVSLSGAATAVASRVFLKFDATNGSGDRWSGRGNFTIETAGQMRGNIEPKSGPNVPLTLRKIQ